MVSAGFDVFLSHTSADKAAVRSIAGALARRGVRAWFDEEQMPAGTLVAQSVQRGMVESRVIAVFFGQTEQGRWHQAEMEAAIHRQIELGRPVIPVLLPGHAAPDDATLPPFLAVRRWVEFRDGLDDARALDDLERGIMGRVTPPGAGDSPPSRGVAGAAPDPDDAELDAAVVRFAAMMQRGESLTLFVGTDFSPQATDLPPPSGVIAQHLLTELKFSSDGQTAPRPSLDAAGAYYEIENGARGLEMCVTDLIGARCQGVSTLHDRIAALVGRVGALRREPRLRRQPPPEPLLLVTTSLDTMCERALLRAGVSFTRIVQHRSGTQLTLNAYRDVRRLGGALTVRQGDQGDTTVDLASADALDGVVATCGLETVRIGAGGAGPQLGKLALTAYPEPFLYKYHGSHDVRNSCALSTDDYLRLAVQSFVPDRVLEIIGNSSALFLVCCTLDADVRHVYHTLLRRAYQVDDDGLSRTAIVCPPREPEARLWAQAKKAAQMQMRIAVVEGSSEAFLTKLLARTEAGAAAPASPAGGWR